MAKEIKFSDEELQSLNELSQGYQNIQTGFGQLRVQKILLQLKERRMGILITDHNVRETLKLVDRAYIIHKGDIYCDGESEELVNDPKAREIYLGPEFNL